MSTFKWFASFLLAATLVPALPAEPHCPGNVASVPLRLTNSHQMIVAVSVNHSGPYNFLLDTGTQITMVDPSLAAELHLNTQGSAVMVDPSLAAELHLNTQGSAVVAGVGFNAAASFAQLDLLEAGSHSVANQKVLVFDLQNPHSVDLHFRGVLGEDFLSQFDMLIDNAHNLLCLDDSSTMRADVKGPHIALLTAPDKASGGPSFSSLIISVRLSDGTRPVRLKLDSGTNAPFLFESPQYMPPGSIRRVGGGLNGTQRSFATLPPQNLKIGPLEFPSVSFSTFADSQKDSRPSAFDGLLTLGLFRCVFICHADHFAVFEPW
jgi:Aspartyl protease